MPRYTIVLAIAGILFAFVTFYTLQDGRIVLVSPSSELPEPLKTMEIGGQTVSVSIADTPELRERGLSRHSGLRDHEGMFFIFPEDGYYAFWMKDMHFAIDMVWISSAGTVVFIKPEVSPGTYPNTFTSPDSARYVVELPSGFCRRYGVKVGEKVRLP